MASARPPKPGRFFCSHNDLPGGAAIGKLIPDNAQRGKRRSSQRIWQVVSNQKEALPDYDIPVNAIYRWQEENGVSLYPRDRAATTKTTQFAIKASSNRLAYDLAGR